MLVNTPFADDKTPKLEDGGVRNAFSEVGECRNKS